MGRFTNSSGGGTSSKALNNQFRQRDRNNNNNFYMNRSRNAGNRINHLVGNHLNSDDLPGKKNHEAPSETTE
jgi:hypothetical protein